MSVVGQPRAEALPFRTNSEEGLMAPSAVAEPAAVVMNPGATPLSVASAIKARVYQLSTIVSCCNFNDTSSFASVMGQPVEEAEMLVDWLVEMLGNDGREGGAA